MPWQNFESLIFTEDLIFLFANGLQRRRGVLHQLFDTGGRVSINQMNLRRERGGNGEQK